MDNSINFNDIWQETLEFLKQDAEVGAVKVNMWLSPVKPISMENGTFTLEVPNVMFKQTLQSRYEQKIISFIKALLRTNSDLHAEYLIAAELPEPLPNINQTQTEQTEYQIKTNQDENIEAESSVLSSTKPQAENTNLNNISFDKTEEKAPEQSSLYEKELQNASWQPEYYRNKEALEQTAQAPNPHALHPHFNPDYTFETFIVGSSNRFAFAAAQALVNNHQSPFFIYSAPGLGKTHLLHAMAHGLYRLNPQVKVLLSATETFVNEFIRDVVKYGSERAEAFRNKYRNLDCLLLDDVQFLLEKDKSVEEFFYTFNTLFESKKRIVITSDRPPQELELGERLISRFMSGTVADIRIPDFETRVAILRQKAEQWKYDIPLDIINFIATKVRNGGRELEGCLITINNFCRNTGARATIDVVQDLLKDHFRTFSDNTPISIDIIKKVVAERYHVDVKDLSCSKRDETIVRPRMVAVYLATILTDITLEKIGAAFNRNHASIIHLRDKMKEKVTEPYENAEINDLIKKIKDVNNTEENS